MKRNVMLKATEPSEGVIERNFCKSPLKGLVERKCEFSLGVNAKPKHGFWACKVLPKATVPSEGVVEKES